MRPSIGGRIGRLKFRGSLRRGALDFTPPLSTLMGWTPLYLRFSGALSPVCAAVFVLSKKTFY